MNKIIPIEKIAKSVVQTMKDINHNLRTRNNEENS